MSYMNNSKLNSIIEVTPVKVEYIQKSPSEKKKLFDNYDNKCKFMEYQ